jgi:hypothetical protein
MTDGIQQKTKRGARRCGVRRRQQYRNHCPSLSGLRLGDRVVTYSPTKKNGEAVASQEANLLDLLYKAQTTAFAMAHGYDVSGHPDQAWGLIGVGDCIRDAAVRLNEAAQGGAKKQDAAYGLRLRAVLLRKQMRGPAWANASGAPLVPRLAQELSTRKKSAKRTSGRVR